MLIAQDTHSGPEVRYLSSFAPFNPLPCTYEVLKRKSKNGLMLALKNLPVAKHPTLPQPNTSLPSVPGKGSQIHFSVTSEDKVIDFSMFAQEQER